MQEQVNQEIIVQDILPEEHSKSARGGFSDLPLSLMLVALALLFNYLFWIAGHFGGFSHILLSSTEELHFAAVARNIARGFGLIDPIIHPDNLFNFPKLPMPYLGKTFFPVLQAPFMLLVPGQVGAVLPAWLSYGLLVGLTYYCARRYVSWVWAVLASVLVALNPYFIARSTGALPLLPTALFVLLFISGMIRKMHPLFLGAFWALVLYMRPEFFVFIPIVLPLTMLFGRRPRTPRFIMHFILGWLIISWPWLFRNAFVMGAPFYGYLSFSDLGEITGRPVDALSLCIAPAVVALCFLASLLRKRGQTRFFAIVAMILIIAFYGFFNYWSLEAAQSVLTPVRELGPEDVAQLLARTSRDTIIGSDVPEAVAWQCDRQTLALPENEETFRMVNKIASVDYLYFKQGLNSIILADYNEGGWFPYSYLKIEDETEEADISLMFQKKGLDIAKASKPQLLHFKNTLAMFQDNQIIHVAGPRTYEGPIACPPEIERVRWNNWTGGIYMKTSRGQIWTLGSANGIPFVPNVGEIVDFCVTPSGKGCLFLMTDGNIIAWGDASDLPTPENNTVKGPFRIEITRSGKGYYVLSKYGTVAAFGDAEQGYSPWFYPQKFAADIALDPDGKGYYILDVYGAIHNSTNDLPLLLGQYNDKDFWAIDLEILDNGSAYVLSDDGVLYHYRHGATEPNE